MWQKCPACNSTGKEFPSYANATAVNCSVCNGAKIISELTGLPPGNLEIEKEQKNFNDCMLEAFNKNKKPNI